LQHKKKLTFVWNIFALDTNKDRRILTGIIEESYFSKVELFIPEKKFPLRQIRDRRTVQ